MAAVAAAIVDDAIVGEASGVAVYETEALVAIGFMLSRLLLLFADDDGPLED